MIIPLSEADAVRVHVCFEAAYDNAWSLDALQSTLRAKVTLGLGWVQNDVLLGFILL